VAGGWLTLASHLARTEDSPSYWTDPTGPERGQTDADARASRRGWEVVNGLGAGCRVTVHAR
jgi:hypothetical protein